jgi:signal transduction histidine kinase
MKKYSLKTTIWIYLAIFAFAIMATIWLLQIMFLNTYYEWSKKKVVQNVTDKIEKLYKQDNYQILLDSLAYQNNLCIEIFENKEVVYTTDSASRGCVLNEDRNSQVKKYKEDFIASDSNSIKYVIVNSVFENKTLLYGIKMEDDSYAFISASLQPIDSTVDILKSQFIYITLLALVLSFVIAYFVSQKISRPIIKINKASKEMSKGNYNVKFDDNEEISEINELAVTLDKTSKELAKTESLRRELLANVSHDLKTPLTIIQANAEMVRDLTYKDEKKRNDNLSVIVKETKRLNSLVEDILNLSKLQSNTVQLKIEKFNITDVITSIIKTFKVLEEKEGYKIEFNCKKEYYINADKKKIEQVIYNLINNAINYTGDDKCVYLNIEELEDNQIRIKVTDTGKGIDDADIDYIWDKYYKVDKSYKRVTVGTGLGLSIVKNILVNHQFKYGVITKKNNGTTFYFDCKYQTR